MDLRGALKTRSWSGLDSWIVHSWEVFDSWIVPAWSLKNEELFQIGLLDRLMESKKRRSCSGLDSWIVHF